MKKLLDGDEVENLCEPATQVCQWRARAVDGSSFNCEFWYNHGTLNGDELLEQFTQVVMRCETAGFRVLGFVCDAGGPNTRLMKLLRDGREVPEGGWLPLETVVAVNPYDPSRRICLFHCSTHELKSLRNALYTSWTKVGKKQFLDANDVKIGKGLVEEMFQKDRQREVEGVAPLSEIRESTVILNKWSVMNAAEAKRKFSWKTLVASLNDLYDQLDTPMIARFDIGKHGALGFMPAAAKHLQELVKSENHLVDILSPKISSFKWMANVHEIYNAILMNTDISIKKYNIDK